VLLVACGRVRARGARNSRGIRQIFRAVGLAKKKKEEKRERKGRIWLVSVLRLLVRWLQHEPWSAGMHSLKASWSTAGQS
jgi:hypothetical protein